MAHHYHVINSETGEDYAEGGVRTLAEARAALAEAKVSYSGNDVWLLGSVREGEIRVYRRGWVHPHRADCHEADYDAAVSICEGGVPGVECVCDD